MKNPYLVPGLERGLKLLQLFRPGRTELGAPEIARELGLPRSTAFRLLQTLKSLEIIERTANGAVRLGPAVLRLGFELVASLEIGEYGREVVEKLCLETGASSQLAILDHREIVIVLKKNPSSTFVSSVQVGTRMPAHATVIGRILLQDLSGAQLRKLFPEGKFKQLTRQTPKTVAELERLIAQDRSRGYAVSESAYESGISAVAAPVRNHEQKIVAGLSLIVALPQLDAKRREDLVKKAVGAATQLSRRLSYRQAA